MVQDKIRLEFYKKGRMKYISHLDLIRTMTGALGRAEIPVYYSEGFNPHPKMVFALPLSVGCESVCEYLDIKLLKAMDENDLLSSLNEQFPDDMQFTRAYARVKDFSTIASSKYEIRLYNKELTEEMLKKLFVGEIMITKKTKKGFTDVDITPNIISYDITAEDDCLLINTILCARPDSYANPVHLVNGLSAKSGLELDDYDIMRLCVYDDKGEVFE